jgi:hypothetical protein
MRHFLGRVGRVLLIAVPSFVMGATMMAYLAATASLVSFKTLRAGYASGEQVAAECARVRGDTAEAARHYANVVSTYADDSWWRKNPHIKTWPLWYPFIAIARHYPWSRVSENRATVEALYRIRLANVLSDEGREDLAADQLARAAELYGPDGQTKVEAVRAKLPQMDASVALPLELCRSSDPTSASPR